MVADMRSDLVVSPLAHRCDLIEKEEALKSLLKLLQLRTEQEDRSLSVVMIPSNLCFH